MRHLFVTRLGSTLSRKGFGQKPVGTEAFGWSQTATVDLIWLREAHTGDCSTHLLTRQEYYKCPNDEGRNGRLTQRVTPRGKHLAFVSSNGPDVSSVSEPFAPVWCASVDTFNLNTLSMGHESQTRVVTRGYQSMYALISTAIAAIRSKSL